MANDSNRTQTARLGEQNDTTSARDRTRAKGGLAFEHDVSGDGDRRRVTINQNVDPSEGGRLTTAPAGTDALEYDDRPSVPGLPASGETYDTCGEPFHGLFCSDPSCLETHEVGMTCQRSRCPRCYKSWAFRRARKQVAKLESLRHDRERAEGSWQKFHHLTVSFRPDVRVQSDDPVKRLRKVTQALLDEVNVEHGLAVFHNYRIKPEYRGEVLGHDSGDGDMTWKDILGKLEGDKWSAEAVYDEFLEYAPHFHVMCVSEFVQCGAITEQIADETGVVIHRIADNSGTSLETINDLAAATMYSLSHAGLEQRGDSFRARYQAFGRLANHAVPESGWAEQKADDACRKAAPDVLGLSVAKPECDAPVEPEGSDPGPVETPNGPRSAAATTGGTSRRSSPNASTSLPAAPSSTALPSRDTEWSAGSNTGYSAVTDGGRDAVATQEAAAATEPSADDLDRCGATLRPIRLAKEYLECSDVAETADPDAIDNLRQRYEEYTDLGKPEPMNDPPPDDGTGPPE